MSDNILHTPSMYRDMATSAIPELEEYMPTETAMDVARQIAHNFCRLHGGKRYRVPNLQRVEKVVRDREIREQGQTLSADQIAREHGLSARAIRRILQGE